MTSPPKHHTLYVPPFPEDISPKIAACHLREAHHQSHVSVVGQTKRKIWTYLGVGQILNWPNPLMQRFIKSFACCGLNVQFYLMRYTVVGPRKLQIVQKWSKWSREFQSQTTANCLRDSLPECWIWRFQLSSSKAHCNLPIQSLHGLLLQRWDYNNMILYISAVMHHPYQPCVWAWGSLRILVWKLPSAVWGGTRGWILPIPRRNHMGYINCRIIMLELSMGTSDLCSLVMFYQLPPPGLKRCQVSPERKNNPWGPNPTVMVLEATPGSVCRSWHPSWCNSLLFMATGLVWNKLREKAWCAFARRTNFHWWLVWL